MDKFYEFIRRFSSLIAGLSDNAAFVALIASYPSIEPKTLIILHLVAMVAKSIYLKGNKVVPEKEIPVDIINPEKPVETKELVNVRAGQSFSYGNQLYIATNQVKNSHCYVVNLSTGEMKMFPDRIIVTPKNVVLSVK